MPAAGQILDHYRVEEKLGEGAFGEVWCGVDVRLDRRVALKLPRARTDEDAEAWGRLLEEARAASALNHPYICATYDIGEEDGAGYIAMEYVEGQPLSEVLRAGPIPATLAASYGIEIAGALAHAHSRGVIHRDLKASNVMITPEGHTKLLDFGLARRLDATTIESLTQSRQSLAELGGAAGTLCYMAPEVLHGKPATRKSDLWSLGALLYEILSGRLPFEGQTPFELSMAIMVEDPPPLDARLPEQLRTLIRKCLEKDPAQRPADAAEIQAKLEQSKAALARTPRFHNFVVSRFRVVAAALIAVLALSGISFAWWHRRASQRPAAAITLVRQSPPLPAPGPAGAPSIAAPSQSGTTGTSAPSKSQPSSRQNSASHSRNAGDPNTDVWVNLKTKVYHCPGTRWYKKTENGKLLKQRQAELAGYHAASNKPCE